MPSGPAPSPSTNAKYAVMERERRFLLDAVPPGASAPRSIEDWYLEGTRLRLRTVRWADGRAEHKLGQKVRPDPGDPAVVLHTTCYLDQAEFAVLRALPGRLLRKTRWQLDEGGHRWAIDVFADPQDGLVLAEVDLGCDGELVMVPPWCGHEVTDDERFTGGALAAAGVDRRDGRSYGARSMGDLELAPPSVRMERRDDGTILLTSRHELGAYPGSIGDVLRRWATEAPDRPALAQRPGNDVTAPWQLLTYAEVWRRATSLATRLLDANLGPDHPVAILSGNSIGHALVTFAGYLAGVPVVPVSPAYSLLSTDLAKLRHIVDLTEPGLVYVDAAGSFARALDAVAAEHVWTAADLDTADAAQSSDHLPTIDPDAVAKILFTSGSTGVPKGVVTTQRMMCSNQQALAQIWPFTAATPPILCDWLPWSHVFGGSHNLNLAVWQGGTMYIDGGRPTPADVATTVANLADVGPTISFNVPAGYGAILPLLEADDEAAAGFFRRLQLVFYAAAALPQDLWDRMEALSERITGRRVPMTSSWGATETAPMATAAHFPLERAGVVGVPIPGTTIKLVPSGNKLEVRVRGDNVTPGYFRAPELTAAAFDEEGFYRIGDAMRLVDPDVPERGLAFDGRVAEDFKLSTGTWVSVGTLRPAVLAACSPLLHDAVVTGHDRDEIGLVAWLTPAAATQNRADVEAELQAKLAAYNARQQGSSTRIGRFVLTDEPPSIDRGEITDKGYLNQRAVLDARTAVVQALHAGRMGTVLRDRS